MNQSSDICYQILTPEGEVVGDLPDFSSEQFIDLYRWMVFGRTFSNRMVALQRQGRMGTFAPMDGHEAAALGMALPLQQKDWLVTSYRETLSHLVKGVPVLAEMKQWGGFVAADYPPDVHCLPFQIVLGTQMPQAVGLAQAIKYKKHPYVVLASCGDGATSQGDFNEALNFAGVFQVPLIVVVHNNQWAISTPRHRQTAATHIADRGLGFGLPSYLVDGGDVFAVYQIVSECVERARAGAGPALIEAVTYRLAAHTTADDPTKYRSLAEVARYAKSDPLRRYRKFLSNHRLLTEDEDKGLHEAVAAEIQAYVEAYESLPPQSPTQLFQCVYAKQPVPQYQQQAAFLKTFSSPAASIINTIEIIDPKTDQNSSQKVKRTEADPSSLELDLFTLADHAKPLALEV